MGCQWYWSGQFSHPTDIAVDSSGNVYVVDQGNNRVEKFANTGAYATQWGSFGSGNGLFLGPYGVAVDSLGNVYVTDSGNNRVEKFSSTGIYTTQINPTGPNQFNVPRGVAVDGSGNVFVTDSNNNRVEEFSSAGIYVRQWNAYNAIGFASPIGVAVDSSGNVYVIDNGHNYVDKFTGTGSPIAQWGGFGSGDGKFNGPYYVAVDGSGNVYVVDDGNNRVQKFTSTGTFITTWGSPGSGNGEFTNPWGVAVDSSGNVYAADSANNRVELFGDSVLASVSLVAGWNLISLPIMPLSTTTTKVLAGLIAAGNLTIVWSYQGGSWRVFTPPSSGSLTTMVDGLGYWLYITRPSTLNVLGYTVTPGLAPPTYSLLTHWNLAGFKPISPSQNETVGTYLTSISGDYTIIMIYNNTDMTWVKGRTNMWLVPGQAFWIYMNTAEVLIPE